MASKHHPERQCVACRTRAPREQLLRVLVTSDGRFVVEPGPRDHGRSAYVCRTRACVETATRRKSWERAFKRNPPSDLLQRLTSLVS